VGLWVSGIEERCTYVRGGAGGRTQVNATKRQWNQRNQPSTVAAIMGNTHPWLIQSARKGQRHLAAVPRSVLFCSFLFCICANLHISSYKSKMRTKDANSI